ncbi:hypothetical protein SAMN05660284_01592 [Formivibrio citricus]|uniref:Uncharacterized protein n=1 Tax=Formivibrio citricus TaxID=83765 RepID=A0A1I4ZE25_9NEIS|nr:hypothetical protein [Formivibrio citricus]SFN48229.1 hypothetical protein SAMN05660284_01592 [Formivibrio citricus]
MKIEALNQDDRPWRIDSIGDLAYPNLSYRRTQPSFQVAMSPILVDLNDTQALLSPTATDISEQRRPWCSLGILPFLRVGDIWKSGKLLRQPDYQLQTFVNLEINQDTTALIKAGLSTENKQFLLPLREHPWHRSHTQAYCLRIQLPDDHQIVIPCWELIRFYFGSSSRLIHTIFQYTLKKEMLFTDNITTHGGHGLHLVLADGIPGRSAADIGRIAMSNVAWRSVLRVASSCLRASTQGELIYPNTFFPFEGKTNLVVAGKWLPLGKQENMTFMVFNIRSCSHPFPFESLKYECSTQKNPAIAQQKESSSETKPSIARTSQENENIILKNVDPGKNLSSALTSHGNDIRFPDLENKEVWRAAEIDKSDHGSVALIHADNSVEVHATGTPVAYDSIRAVELTLGKGMLSTIRQATLPRFLREALKTLQENGNLKIRLLYPDSSRSPVIIVPKIINDEGEIHLGCHFQYTNGSRRPRKAAVLIVAKPCQTDYVVVLEGSTRETRLQIIKIDAGKDGTFSNNIDIQRVVALAIVQAPSIPQYTPC